MAENDLTTPETIPSPPEVARKLRWLSLIVFLLPLLGLLWVSNWFYQRSRLFTDSHVVLGEPALPWGRLIGDDKARELFGVPVELNSHENELTPYQIGIIGGYTPLKSLHLRGVTDADIRKLKGLANLEVLELDEPQITDEACETIGRFDQLKRLSLGNYYDDSTTLQITDQGLSHLVGLTKLEGLDLPAPGVTDDGLKSIAKLQALTGLELDGTSLSGEGLGDLSKLTNLRVLIIRNWSLKEHALSDLPKLGNFQALGLMNCSLSENCLRPLGECPLLNQLSLTGPNVTDAMLDGLSSITLLRRLDLENAIVTDELLDDLTSLWSLDSLYLRNTKVSRAACERFQQARPEVTISGVEGHYLPSLTEE